MQSFLFENLVSIAIFFKRSWFFRQVARHVPVTKLAKIQGSTLSILENLLSGDPQKVWEASFDVKNLRDEEELRSIADHIQAIKKATKNIDKDSGTDLITNNSPLSFALLKLKFVKDSAGCQCELYPSNPFFNPNKEAEEGLIIISDKVEDAKNWTADYRCACTKCGNKFKVKKVEYHGPLYVWTNLSPPKKKPPETLIKKTINYVRKRL